MKFRVPACALALLTAAVPAVAAPAVAVTPSSPGAPAALVSAPRTLVVAATIDRGAAVLEAYTVKDRPWHADDEVKARPIEGDGAVQVEFRLLGPGGAAVVRRVDVRGLCFDHGPDAEPHVDGDTIRLHRETVTVELPEAPGFDTVDVAYYRDGRGLTERVAAGWLQLVPERFTAAGGTIAYRELAFAQPAVEPAAPKTPGTVHWPEEYGDPDKVRIFGDPSQTATRINVVIVPDGYTYAQKATLDAHAQTVVNYFRSKSPYAEHDPFLNFNLVYAYSTQDGTDQCDCATVRDTAMNTRFPNAGYPCGDSGNRCLYYGTGNGGPNCDPNTSSANIAAAELRAPAKDVTLVMVNTTRYGGCGGDRAVFAGANSSATEIAVHELGHSLGGLADEYESYSTCGTGAGEVNTSLNKTTGAWPEWIADIGAPVQGGQYYTQCVYRPQSNCDMRALSVPFCAVCKQKFALTFFGHPRVNPTAPVSGSTPASPVTLAVGQDTGFAVSTRLATGAAVTNSFTWQLQGPGFPTPTTIATGTPTLTRSFTDLGTYTLTCEVIADTNFVKPAKTGANRDVATWTVNVTTDAEVSGHAASPQLTVARAGAGVDLTFEDVGATHYNVYVSNQASTAPFRVANAANGKKDCAVATTSPGPGLRRIAGYDPNAGISGPKGLLFILVTADNGAGTEGSLGVTSSGGTRSADGYCAH